MMSMERDSANGKVKTPHGSVELPSLVGHFSKDGPRWKFAAACLDTVRIIAVAAIMAGGINFLQRLMQ